MVIFEIANKSVAIGSDEMSFDAHIINVQRAGLRYFLREHNIPARFKDSEFRLSVGNNDTWSVIEEYMQSNDRRGRDTVLRIDASNVDLKSVVEGIFVVLPEYTDDALILRRYQVVNGDLELFSVMEIKVNNGLVYSFTCGNIYDAQDFFRGTFCVSFERLLAQLIWQSQKDCVAIKDFKIEHLEFMRTCYCNEGDVMKTLTYWNYIAEDKFCYYFEFQLRQGKETHDIWSAHPMRSGTPYPDTRNMAKLSSDSLNLINECCANENTSLAYKLFAQLEAHPKIGVNGIKMIQEVNSLLKSIDLDGDWHVLNGINEIRSMRVFANILFIMNTFDITLKTLLDRAIRSAIKDTLSLLSYTQLIYDYVEMKKQFGLTVEDKLPKNVVELHDILAAQVQEIKSEKIKKEFEARAKINAQLSDQFNQANNHPNFIMLVPDVCQDLINEGQNLSHCVGSYVNRIVSGYSKIYFVRMKAHPDDSYVTIELDKNNNLVQASARCNATPNKATMDYIHQFVAFARSTNHV